MQHLPENPTIQDFETIYIHQVPFDTPLLVTVYNWMNFLSHHSVHTMTARSESPLKLIVDTGESYTGHFLHTENYIGAFHRTELTPFEKIKSSFIRELNGIYRGLIFLSTHFTTLQQKINFDSVQIIGDNLGVINNLQNFKASQTLNNTPDETVLHSIFDILFKLDIPFSFTWHRRDFPDLQIADSLG